MAVHKRSYHAYTGALTERWRRFLVVSRYAFENATSSKRFVAYLSLCCFYPLGCALAVYANSNQRLLALFDAASFFDVNGSFFFHFLGVQGFLGFVVTALVGPGLISPDLANNALPLYLCRPFSRAEYVWGKMFVLVALLSLITWVPGELLFLLQSSLAGTKWVAANLWMMGSILLGSAIEILVFSLLALAISAWIKRRLAAGAALLGVFFFGAGFAQAINAVLHTKYGFLFDLANLIGRVEGGLFYQHPKIAVPASDAAVALVAISAFCLFLLEKKVKAYDVVRG